MKNRLVLRNATLRAQGPDNSYSSLWCSPPDGLGAGATNPSDTVIRSTARKRQCSATTPPLLPDPDAYVEQPDIMTPQMRRNYIRDWSQAALTYIAEYEAAQQFQKDPQYDTQQVQQRLQIIYGKVDKVKEKVDAALHTDDIYRRR